MKRAKKGFTLIEVICVLVIIAIVAVIAVPNISRYIENSKINNCKNTMNTFISDLEYKIVSRRYYDVDELNRELVGVVDEASVEMNSGMDPITEDGKFKSLTESITDASGICPNGGNYTVEWIIKPGDDSNSAKVIVNKCECSCMEDHVHVENLPYEFTAALISTADYIKSDLSAEQIYERDIKKIIEYIDSKLENGNPSNIDDVINEYNENTDSKYKVKGVTVKEQRDPDAGKSKWVEWICVDLNKNNDPNFDRDDISAHDFLVYYPDVKNEVSVSDAAEDAVGGVTDKKLVVTPFSENMVDNKANWPPAEGSSGSYLYSEKLPYTNGQVYQVAGVDAPDRIGWIQREEQWYVEKTASSNGIDYLESSNPADLEDPEEHALVSRKELDNISVVSMLDSSPLPTDSRNMLLISASYKGETGNVTFSHLEASDDGSTIRNGFVIVSSEEEYKDKTWAGIYSDSTSKKAADELNTLREILGKEDGLVRDFFSGVTDKLIVAYQEYNKVYNKTTGKYEVKPVTCFGQITMSQRADGVKEIKVGDDVIATIEAVPGNSSDYDIYFDQAVVSGDVFRVEDLSIKKSAEYQIKNSNGDVVGSILVSEDIPHASKAAKGEVAFFVNGNYPQTYPKDFIYDEETEDSSVDHINRGGGRGVILILDPSDEYNYKEIGHIESYENGGYVNWSYDKGENDTEFDVNKLTATVSYKVNVRDNANNIINSGMVSYEYGHKADAGETSEGFYLVEVKKDSNDSEWSSKADISRCDELNNRCFQAEVIFDYYKYSNGNPQMTSVSLCNVVTYFDDITATYTNDGKSFSFDKIDAKANYKTILFKSDANQPAYTIDHLPVTLNHDSEEGNKLRYYMTMISDYQDPYGLKTTELAALVQLYSDYNGETYVAYNDKNIHGNPETKKAKIYVNCTSDINPPEIVYFPFSGSQNAYAVAYTGNNNVVTVNSSYDGYWSDTLPNSSVESKFVKITAGNKDYYYIDDKKTYNITRIGNAPSANEDYQFALPNTNGVTRIEIKNGINEIGPGAFNNNDNSNKIKINEAVIILPDSVNAIGKNAFSGLSIGNITLGNMIKTVAGDGSVTDASSDTSRLLSIGAGAFSGTTLSACDAFVVPETVASIGAGAFSNFKIGNGGLFIDGVSNATTNSIPKDVFNGTEFGRLSFGPRVEKVEAEAFKDNTSSAVLDLGSVNSISGEAFSGWVNAKGDLVIPESVTSIKDFAFRDYAYNNSSPDTYPSLTINGGSYKTDDGVVGLGGMIFTYGHFRNVSIGGKVQRVDALAFRNQPYESAIRESAGKEKMPYEHLRGTLSLSNNITRIGKAAFDNCNWLNGTLVLPSNPGFTEIGDAAFNGCFRFTGDLVIPPSVKVIGARAFNDCTGFNGSLALGSKTETNHLEKIGMEAFMNCKNFTGDLTIPSTVTKGIGNCAFRNFAGNINRDKAGNLTVNAGSFAEGKKLGAFIFTGSTFNDITIGGIVEEIGAYAFKHESENDVDLPDDSKLSEYYEDKDETVEMPVASQKVEGKYSGITGTLFIEDSVKAIGNYAFENSYAVSVWGLQNVQTIGNNAFNNCDKFGESNLNGLKNVQTIGNNAFNGCINLDLEDNLNEMKHVQTIGDNAFRNCKKIKTDLTFAQNSVLVSIGKEAFLNDKGLGNVTIPSSVTTIGDSAFDYTGSGEELKIFGCSTVENGQRQLGYSDPNNTKTLFNHSNYKNVTIGENIDVIGYRFMKTYVKDEFNYDYSGITGNLKIGGHVKEIKPEAFNAAGFNGTLEFTGTELETIGHSAFENLNNMHGDLIIPENVHNIDRRAFKKFAMDAPESKRGKLSIKGYSETYGNQKIIGYRLFSYARFNEVEIGGADSSVNTIGNYAFFNCLSTDTKAERGADGNPLLEDDQHTFKSLSGYDSEVYKVHRKLGYEDDILEINDDTSNYAAFTKKLTILEGIETIGYRAFGDNNSSKDTAIREVDLSNASSLKTINEDAFNRCNYAGGGLTIPKSVEYIGRCAFKKFGADSDNPGQLTILGCSEVKGSMRYIGHPDAKDSDPIFGSAKFKNVVIGESADEASVNAIAKNFMNNQLKLTSGDNDSFDYSSISGKLTIGPSIRNIGDHAFLSMQSFNGALTLNEGLEKIGESAFNDCPWFKGDLLIPSTVTNIGSEAFKHFGQADGRDTNDNRGSLTVYGYSSKSGGLNTIDSGIFNHAHFTNITIGGNVQKIADDFMNNIDIKDEYNGEKVTVFNAVRGNLLIENSVQKIGERAFLGCKNFNGALTLKEGLVTVGENAFNSCTGFNGDLLIPKTVTSIGTEAFKHFGQGNGNGTVNTGSLTILGYSSVNNNLNTIDANIFNYAHFKNVAIDGNVQQIAEGFMKNFDSDKNGPGVTYQGMTGDLTIGNSVQKIGNEAFWDCENFNGRLSIGLGVSYIGETAFSGLYRMYTGDNIKERSLTVPKNVVYMGSYAFKGLGRELGNDLNNKFPALYIYGSSNEDGSLGGENHSSIFSNARFNNVTIGGNVKSIGTSFMNNWKHASDKTRDYNSDDKEINEQYSYIFGDIEIQSSVKSIGDYAFDNLETHSSSGRLILSEGLESIGKEAFSGARFFRFDGDNKNLTIPYTVKIIGSGAFKYFCNEMGEYDPPSLTVLGYSSEKENLKTIDKEIFNYANFKNVTIGGEGGTVQYIAEGFMDNNSYKNEFKNVRGNIIIGQGVKKIGTNAFWNCNGFDGVLKIANTVESIGQSAFSGMYELYTNVPNKEERKLEIPSSVKYMGPYAFKALSAKMDENTQEMEVDKYPEVYVYGSSGPNGVLGDNEAIFSMARINGLTIGGNVVTIADDFMNNERHSKPETRFLLNDDDVDGSNDHLYSYIYGDLTIKDNVAHIGDRAFKYIQHFNEINTSNHLRGNLTLGEKIETIGEEAFAHVRPYSAVPANQRNLKIPSKVRKIGQKAFEGFCSNFTFRPSLTIEGYSENDSNHTLGTNIFPGASFENVTIGGSVRHIAGNAFMGSEYNDIVGTLYIVKDTVGLNNKSLSGPNWSGEYTGYGLQFAKPRKLIGIVVEQYDYGPFRGCNFYEVKFYSSLNSYQSYIFNTNPRVKRWDSNGNEYTETPGFRFVGY